MPELLFSQAARAIVTPRATSILREAAESAYRDLVVHGPTPELASKLLAGVTPEQIIARPIKHEEDAKAALAGLWLWHDALDESHRISQEIASSTGSFWHAIMHRREGDFSNSRYWYHRCANHHVLKMMGAVAASLAGDAGNDRSVAKALSGGWSPDGFVDLVAAVHDKPNDPRYEVAVKLQQAEWASLFDYCIHEAVEAIRDEITA